MFFYTDYNPATDTRSVLSYDEKKHGMPRVVSPDMTFLYNGSLCTRRVYDSEAEALAVAWGKYSDKPVVMPDGSKITPAHYFEVNAMTEKQIEEFYDACPSGYCVEETRVFDMASLRYVTVGMRYIELF